MGDDKITKATTHISQNEGLIFEKSSPGKKAYRLPPLDVPEVDEKQLLGKAARRYLGHLELRGRSRHVSSGLLHHEVQPAGERVRGAA